MTPEHRELRRQTINGTDAAAIIGVCPYSRTPFDVWMEKKQPLVERPRTPAEQERMEWGNALEDTIAREYARKQGVVIWKPGYMRHKTSTWLGGSPDFLVAKGDGTTEYGIDVKNVSEWAAREWGSGPDDVPMGFIVQCQHYMMLTELTRWDLVALFGGNRSRTYTLYASEKLQQLLYQAEEQFYREYIVGDKKPDFAGSTSIQEFLRRQYPRDEGSVIVVDEEDAGLYLTVVGLVALQGRRKAIEEAEARATSEIMAAMGSASELQVPGQAVVRWKKTRDTHTTNWRQVAAEAIVLLPLETRQALLAKHSTITPGVRRFAVLDKSEHEDE